MGGRGAQHHRHMLCPVVQACRGPPSAEGATGVSALQYQHCIRIRGHDSEVLARTIFGTQDRTPLSATNSVIDPITL